MSPKRKIISSDTSDEEDSFKHRRTSLRVNLSYANLTDSGNGSLWRTEIENEEAPHESRAGKEPSGSKGENATKTRSHLESDKKDNRVARERAASDSNKVAPDWAKEGVQLKDLRVHLENIGTKERALETKCRRLKDAILSKAKEVFDEEHELSIKITKVLRNGDNCRADDTRAESESVLVSSRTSDHASNIIETPSNHRLDVTKKRRNSIRDIDKSRLPQRQLFDRDDNKQGEEETKCRIIEHVVLRNLPVSILRQSEQGGSPILSGSNRRLSLLRKRSEDRLGKLNSTHSTIYSVRSADIGTPVVCSTFVEGNATDDEAADRNRVTDQANSDVDASPAARTINAAISMEITKTHGDSRASERHESLQNRDASATKCVEKEEAEESEGNSPERDEGTIRRPKDAGNSRFAVESDVESSDSHCTDDEDDASVRLNATVVPGGKFEGVASKACEARKSGTKTESERQRALSLSRTNETIRSSLNVNTSLDAADECDGAGRPKRAPIILDDQRESTSTVRTSLQVNTSADRVAGPSKLSSLQDRFDPDVDRSSANNRYSKVAESTGTNNVDFLENISLLERLRNVSRRKPLSRAKSSAPGRQDAREESTNVPKNAVSGKSQKNMRSSGDSCVEATPYPETRSVLLRTLLKHKTHNAGNSTSSCSNGTNPIDNGKESDTMKSSASIPKSLNDASVSTGTSKTVGIDTVILEDTPSSDPFITQRRSSNDKLYKLFVTRDQSPNCDPCVAQSKSVPENVSGKANLEAEEKQDTPDSQSVEYVPTKVGKRKLLPLSDGSQMYSITPTDENKCPGAKKTPMKRIKKLRKKKILNAKKDKSVNKPKKTSEPMSSESDDETSKDRKKQDKKTRKPRKVISKKIVIKKLANDNNVLNILEKEKLTQQNKRNLSRESRDSLDEFVTFRTIPIQRNYHKSHKIVIVTTGLSKGDKSLVKSIVKSLGNAEMELNVSKRTTHVVSSGVRTVNLLRGIIRGCWLVTLEWVLKSLENNRWLNPEEFEMKHFSKAVQENRKDRQLFGPSYIPELFTTCGFIYVEHKTTVPCATLKELIKTAGGHITENAKLGKIIIGPSGLKETWVIDCITTGELQLTQFYKRQ